MHPSAIAGFSAGTAAYLASIVILSVCWALSAFLTGLIALRAAPGQEVPPVNSLIQSLIRVVVLSLGLLVILGQIRCRHRCLPTR